MRVPQVEAGGGGSGGGINLDKQIVRHSRIGHRQMREGNSYTQLQAAVRSDHRLPSYGILHTYDQQEGYCRLPLELRFVGARAGQKIIRY